MPNDRTSKRAGKTSIEMTEEGLFTKKEVDELVQNALEHFRKDIEDKLNEKLKKSSKNSKS
jgi:flagellar basal body-associated protein FliL